MKQNWADHFEAIADEFPDRLVYVCGDRALRWGEYDDRAARIGSVLSEFGLGADSKVAQYLYNCPEYLESFYASLKQGCVPVNVNYRYLADELLYLLDNSDTELLFFHGSLADRVDVIRDRAPKLRAVVQVDDGSPHLDGALRYEELIASREPSSRIARPPDDLALMYTGGTTGLPKGVLHPLARMLDELPATMSTLGIETAVEDIDDLFEAIRTMDERDTTMRTVCAVPYMHGSGIFMGILWPAAIGGLSIGLTSRSFDADELWNAVTNNRTTTIAFIGDAFARPMLAALEAAEKRNEPYDLSSVELMVSTGAILSSEIKEGLLARGRFSIRDTIGSSEARAYGSSVSTAGASAGTATFMASADAILISETGTIIERGSGQAGILANPTHVLGYYKDPEKTARTFFEHDGRTYCLSGDYATIDEHGLIRFIGRGSGCITTGGEKVFPEEVEAAILEHGAVVDCAVVGVPHERWGQAVTAVVVFNPGRTVPLDEIVGHVRERLANYKVPKHVLIARNPVRQPNGKIDYQGAREFALKELASGDGA